MRPLSFPDKSPDGNNDQENEKNRYRNTVDSYVMSDILPVLPEQKTAVNEKDVPCSCADSCGDENENNSQVHETGHYGNDRPGPEQETVDQHGEITVSGKLPAQDVHVGRREKAVNGP